MIYPLAALAASLALLANFAEAQESEVIEIAKADSNVGKHLAGQNVKRAIYVRGRIVNFVVGG